MKMFVLKIIICSSVSLIIFLLSLFLYLVSSTILNIAQLLLAN